MAESTVEDVIHAALKYRRISADAKDPSHLRVKGTNELNEVGHAQSELFRLIDLLPNHINQRSKGRILK